MKEIYESPELNLISYVPAENLAARITLDDLLAANVGGDQSGVESGDIGIDF